MTSHVSRRGFLRAAGAGAGVTATAVGSAAAAEGGQTATVELGDYYFKPGTDSPLYIKPGTEVTFEWKTGGHNIHVDSQPDGANWKGHEPTEGQGFTYSHTFDTKGKYHYWCVPHKGLGMVGDIVVNDSGQAPGGGEYQSLLTDSAKTVGVAATGGMISVLGLAYFFLKYGGDYGEFGEEE